MNTKSENWHGTTIIGVLKNNSVCGDGQVTLGQTVIKTVAKVQKLNLVVLR